MSHSKEREEKVCLNCGTQLTGRYCQACGQENTEPKETVWTLVSHFFNDITHFDGKFFSTVKYLISKPGFLSAEYIKGRRASYLHPIRMYVFTSAFFFIIFFSVFNMGELIKGGKDNAEQLKELTEASSSLREKLPAVKDAELKAAMVRAIGHIDGHASILQKKVAAEQQKDSARLAKSRVVTDSAAAKLKENPQLAGAGQLLDSISEGKKQIRTRNMGFADIVEYDYHSQAAYDSVQHELPPKKRDGWLVRQLIYKNIIYATKYKNDKKEAGALFFEKLMHSLPQALFVSLPIFALILLILYTRRNFYYADHAIFAIHLYCAAFIFLLIYFGIDKAAAASGWGWLSFVQTLIVLSIFFYLYKAMRNFYRQGRGKTILKFILLNFLSFMVVILLIFVYTALSVIRFS